MSLALVQIMLFKVNQIPLKSTDLAPKSSWALQFHKRWTTQTTFQSQGRINFIFLILYFVTWTFPQAPVCRSS